ncbi:hypothetical protein [Klebsiella pneumoniae]|uniref:hypothetical protein n=1 Tax=Klebsiella pneumoniae TaxID=573 RepID=UPI00388F6435
MSFITAFKLSTLSRYTHIISNRVAGGGFNLYFNNGLYMSVIYPSGNTVIVDEGSVIMPEVDKWYVAAGIFDPANNNVRVQFSDRGAAWKHRNNFPGERLIVSAVSYRGRHNR